MGDPGAPRTRSSLCCRQTKREPVRVLPDSGQQGSTVHAERGHQVSPGLRVGGVYAPVGAARTGERPAGPRARVSVRRGRAPWITNCCSPAGAVEDGGGMCAATTMGSRAGLHACPERRRCRPVARREHPAPPSRPGPTGRSGAQRAHRRSLWPLTAAAPSTPAAPHHARPPRARRAAEPRAARQELRPLLHGAGADVDHLVSALRPPSRR